MMLAQIWSTSGWGSPAATLMVLAMLMGFALIVIGVSIRAKQKNDRMRLMEKALHANTLDDELRRQLLDHLSGRNQPRPQWLETLSRHLVFLSKNALFVVGWLGLFTGIALFVVGAAYDLEGLGIAGGISSLVSFGIVTVPLALREVERRRA